MARHKLVLHVSDFPSKPASKALGWGYPTSVQHLLGNALIDAWGRVGVACCKIRRAIVVCDCLATAMRRVVTQQASVRRMAQCCDGR
jgi:hypothetical protein